MKLRDDDLPRNDDLAANDDLPRIGAPATRALAAIGVTRLAHLTSMREADLLAMHGIGPRVVDMLREALAERGWRFRR